MITIWHKCEPPRDEYVLAVTPKARHYTNIGIVKPKGLVNVFELRDGGYVFLSEVKMWCRLPKDRENRKSKYIEEQQKDNFKYKNKASVYTNIRFNIRTACTSNKKRP